MNPSPATMPAHRAPVPVQAVLALYELQLNTGYWMTRCPTCPTQIPRHRTSCRGCEETT